jgi:cyclopropane fatty-acyl-phospholipid synthase-like methyltransferase
MMEESNHDWDARYKTDETPWVTGKPAEELVQYYKQLGKAPGEALEVGCGIGTDSIFMAQSGSHVTATEISPTAIETAKKNAEAAKVAIDFALCDILVQSPVNAGSIDFVFDRGVFHVMTLAQQPAFVSRIAEVLRDGGTWLCLAGNADQRRDPAELGPPQLTAMQLISAVESHFELLKLDRGYFQLPNGSKHLSWVVLLGKRKTK